MRILEGVESCRDESTGLYNRTGFAEIAEMEFDRALQKHNPFTLVYMNLENLESIPYESRDMLLLAVVADLFDHVRKSDVLARLDENEFVILMPDVGPDSASTILPNLRKSLSAELHNYDWDVTASLGAITYLTPPFDVDSMIRTVEGLLKSSNKELRVIL